MKSSIALPSLAALAGTAIAIVLSGGIRSVPTATSAPIAATKTAYVATTPVHAIQCGPRLGGSIPASSAHTCAIQFRILSPSGVVMQVGRTWWSLRRITTPKVAYAFVKVYGGQALACRIGPASLPQFVGSAIRATCIFGLVTIDGRPLLFLEHDGQVRWYALVLFQDPLPTHSSKISW